MATHGKAKMGEDSVVVASLRQMFLIPDEYGISVPMTRVEFGVSPPKKLGPRTFAITRHHLVYGMQLPLQPLLKSVLEEIGVPPLHLTPKAILQVVGFLKLCEEVKLEPTMDNFFAVHKLTESPDSKNNRWYFMARPNMGYLTEKTSRESCSGWEEFVIYVTPPPKVRYSFPTVLSGKPKKPRCLVLEEKMEQAIAKFVAKHQYSRDEIVPHRGTVKRLDGIPTHAQDRVIRKMLQERRKEGKSVKALVKSVPAVKTLVKKLHTSNKRVLELEEENRKLKRKLREVEEVEGTEDDTDEETEDELANLTLAQFQKLRRPAKVREVSTSAVREVSTSAVREVCTSAVREVVTPVVREVESATQPFSETQQESWDTESAHLGETELERNLQKHLREGLTETPFDSSPEELEWTKKEVAAKSSPEPSLSDLEMMVSQSVEAVVRDVEVSDPSAFSQKQKHTEEDEVREVLPKVDAAAPLCYSQPKGKRLQRRKIAKQPVLRTKSPEYVPLVWEAIVLGSMDGENELCTEVAYISFDQSKVGGPAACSFCVLNVVRWLLEEAALFPPADTFENYLLEAVKKWNEARVLDKYANLPSGYFDLHTALGAKAGGDGMFELKSDVAFLTPPEEARASGLDVTELGMAFKEQWDQYAESVADGELGHKLCMVVGWNEHFFVVTADDEACYLIDSFGNRLVPDSTRAYVLKFDRSTTIRAIKKTQNYQIVKKLLPDYTESAEQIDFFNGTPHEHAREYFLRFLASVPVKSTVDLAKNHQLDKALSKLQVEFTFLGLKNQGAVDLK